MVQRLVGAVGVAVTLLAGAAGLLIAQTAPVLPSTVLPSTVPSLEPGLAVSIESVADPSSSDMRRGRLVALYVPAGTAPAAYVPPGAFKATWRGNLNLRIPGQYVFSAEGTGAIRVTVNEQVVLDAGGPKLSDNSPGTPVKLKRGVNTLVAEYSSLPDGDACVRLMWSEKQRPPEPLSPTLFTFDATDPAYRRATQRSAGRSLFARLRCVKCHQPDEPALPDGAMPELAMEAPSLANVGDRLNAAWMAQWIADPRSLRADAAMPKVFHEAAQDKARDLAAFLATLTTGEAASAPVPAADEARVGAGGRLFTGLGCMNCHVPPDQEAPPADTRSGNAFVRVPLKHVNAKFKPGALHSFLRAPSAHYAWTGMPDFQLSEDEADQLVAFLTSRTPVDAIPAQSADGGDPERGKALLLSSGCLNCHAAGDALTSTARAPRLIALQQSDWSRGCVAAGDSARGAAPDFALDENNRASLAAFATSDWASLGRDTAIEFADRQVRSLNCTACHTLDQQADGWAASAAGFAAYEATLPPMTEQERLDAMRLAPDQSRPLLTWVGEKLRPQWMERFMEGQVTYKPRPWLRARMPAFHAQAKRLAAGLALQHGYPPVAADPPLPEPDLAAIGRTLAGKEGGFSCNQCHAIGPAEAVAGFEAPAPNFAHIRDRLNKSFFDRWMFNPQRIHPGTRMPQFADGEGKTSIPQPFDGEARRQFDALWHYILTGNDIQPPK